MKKAAKSSGVKVCVCFECRYSSQFLATKAVIDQGCWGRCTTGRLITITASGVYGISVNTKRELGAARCSLAGCHALDALLLCNGRDVQEVTSYATQSGIRFSSDTSIRRARRDLLRCANGADGKMRGGGGCFRRIIFTPHLVGSEGSLLTTKFHSPEAGRVEQARVVAAEHEDADSGMDVDRSSVPDAVPGVLRRPARRVEGDGADEFCGGVCDASVIAAADLFANGEAAVKVSEIAGVVGRGDLTFKVQRRTSNVQGPPRAVPCRTGGKSKSKS
jgi:predicted dehydrogenase